MIPVFSRDLILEEKTFSFLQIIKNNLFAPCINHPNVIRVFALSGGYSRDEANSRLARNSRMVASFSRALTEGLSAQQSDEEFNLMLNSSIESIYQASIT